MAARLNGWRGWLFAGIHLSIAVVMFAWNEAPYWHFFLRADSATGSTMRLAAWQEDQTTEFNPCAPGGFVDGPVSPMELVLLMQGAPLGVLGFGHTPCTAPSALDRRVESELGARTRRSEAAIGAVTCLGIGGLWLLVGGFPLIRPRRWWLEPGAFITACVVATSNLVIVAGLFRLTGYAGAEVSFDAVRGLCWIATWAVLLGWLVWFGLFVWRLAAGSWRLVLRVRAPAA